MMSSRFNSSRRLFTPRGLRFGFVQVGVLLLFGTLGFRLVYLQIFMRDWLTQRADRQVPLEKREEGKRFQILDRHGISLVDSVQMDSCFVDPKSVKNKKQTAAILERSLNLPAGSVLRKIENSKTSFIWVKRGLTPQASNEIRGKKLPGVGFKKEWRRFYPQGALATHMLGFVGVDGHGLSGLELQYDSTLRKRFRQDNFNKQSHQGNLQLTIDCSIQRLAEQELEWGMSLTKAKRGMIVIQSPKSGEILAQAAFPPMSLDPENPPDSSELRIPAVADIFEPGSTFKIVTVAAALEEKIISPKELFDGEKGAWKIKDITIHDHEPQKMMTIQDIMTTSSNIGTAKIAERLGPQRLYQYCRLFGFGVFPGSGLNGEAKGLLRPVGQWSGVSPYVISFGQELSVSALQIVVAYSVVANRGQLMEPRFIKAIVDDNGKPLWQTSPVSVRQAISEQTAKQLTELLVGVVKTGTGRQAQTLFDPDMRVAGKTGTAQKIDPQTRRYHPSHTIVSFCGFFPADQPQFTIFVMFDEPEGRRWGGTDAAPIFRRIAEKLSFGVENREIKNTY